MLEIVEAGKLNQVILTGVLGTIELDITSARPLRYNVHQDREVLGIIENRQGEWIAIADEELPATGSGEKEEAIRMLLEYHEPIN